MVSSLVVVVGSLNRDLRIDVERRPAPGETLLATDLSFSNGGKGGNQAVAAARAGARVRMVGAVGDDPAGTEQLEELAAFGVDVSGVRRVLGRPTGRAFIVLTPDGENSIVVHSGANALVDPGDVQTYRGARVAVIQTEIGAGTAERAAVAACAAGARLVVNTAPVVTGAPVMYSQADPLVVNEHEAAEIDPGCRSDDPLTVGAALRAATGARSVVVTLGSRGSVVVDGSTSAVLPAAPVARVVDTTGAGDTFVGALAALVANGFSLVDAATQAAEHAGRCVQWAGARPQVDPATEPDPDVVPRVPVVPSAHLPGEGENT